MQDQLFEQEQQKIIRQNTGMFINIPYKFIKGIDGQPSFSDDPDAPDIMAINKKFIREIEYKKGNIKLTIMTAYNENYRIIDLEPAEIICEILNSISN